MPKNYTTSPSRMSTINQVSSKLSCKQHPGEAIINFCLNQHCMVGLCSDCLCSHTDEHVKKRTIPHYQSIKELKNNVIQEITQYLKMFGESREKIANIANYSEILKNQVKDVLGKAKKEVYEAVDFCFDKLSKQLQQDIADRNKFAGTLSVSQLQALSKKIGKKMKELLEQGQQLNSKFKFLDAARKFKIEGLEDYQQFRQNINTAVYSNQEFHCEIKYFKERVQGIEAVIRKLFTLEFNYAKQPQRIIRPVSSVSKINNTNACSNNRSGHSFSIDKRQQQRSNSALKGSIQNSNGMIKSIIFNKPVANKISSPSRSSNMRQRTNNKNHKHFRGLSDLTNSTIQSNFANTIQSDGNDNYLNHVKNVLNMNDIKIQRSKNKMSQVRFSSSLNNNSNNNQFRDFVITTSKQNNNY